MKKILGQIRNATFWELVVLFAGIPLTALEWYLISENLFRYFGLIIVPCAVIGAWLVVKELIGELERTSKIDEDAKENAIQSGGAIASVKLQLPLLRATFKLQSELYGFVALLGFIFGQYRIGLDLDKSFSIAKIEENSAWAAFQAAGLLIMLLFAILALSRKFALAKFERDLLV